MIELDLVYRLYEAGELRGAREVQALRAEVERLKVMAWDWQMKHDEQAAEVERLAREVSDYRDYFDASEPDTRRWPSGNARTETLRQARTAIMSRRIDRTGDAGPTTGQ